MNDRIEQLSQVQLFAGLKPQALELIAKVASEETHAAGTKIFQHGDAGDKLYLILEGRVRISRDVPGMGEEALAVLGPGQIFGEMALLDESPSLGGRAGSRALPSARHREGRLRRPAVFCTRTSPTRCSGASSACWWPACARRRKSSRSFPSAASSAREEQAEPLAL